MDENQAAQSKREFDIVVVGATGFAGRLVARYLAGRKEPDSSSGSRNSLRLAVAGRNMQKLTELAESIRTQYRVELTMVPVNLVDTNSVGELAKRTRAVLTTAGPYNMYGSLLVAACAKSGTHYVDLTGEVPWVRQMIVEHGSAAKESGACIVHCAGFDSIPSDIGTLVLRETMNEAGYGEPESVRMVMGKANGGFSGGTVASMLSVLEQARKNPEVREALSDPDSLVVEQGDDGAHDDQRGPDADGDHGGQRAESHQGRDSGTSGEPSNRKSTTQKRPGNLPHFDRLLGGWTVPFFMGAVNSRVVRRSNALAGYPLGSDPDYRECIAFGKGFGAWARAMLAAAAGGLFVAAVVFAPTRWLLKRFVLPKPGQGPKAAVRGEGYFELTLRGYRESQERARVRVSSDRDPGYGATAIMIAESACLLVRGTPPAGVHTPAHALGPELAEALTASGVRVEKVPARP